LEGKIGIGREENVEACIFRSAKQFTIQKCAPALLGCCPDGVWLQE